MPDYARCAWHSLLFRHLLSLLLRFPPEKENFDSYLAGLREKALNGDADAAKQLVVHYEVSGNVPETSRWMNQYVSLTEKAADAGNVSAMLDLGKLFYTGSRLYPKNMEKARFWFTRAADSGQCGCPVSDGGDDFQGHGRAPGRGPGHQLL